MAKSKRMSTENETELARLLQTHWKKAEILPVRDHKVHNNHIGPIEVPRSGHGRLRDIQGF